MNKKSNTPHILHVALTFPVGFGELVLRQLKKRTTTELKVVHQEDGFLVCTTTLPLDWWRQQRYLQNIFEIIISGQGVASLDEAAKDTTKKHTLKVLPRGSFALRTLNASQPTPLDANLQMKLISLLSTASSSVYVTHRPAQEFWLARRRSGYWFLGRRVPKLRALQRSREAGELSVPFAHLLGLVAGVNARHTVLDPFAGHGGIVRELVAGFSAKVIAIEKETRLFRHLQELAKEKKSIHLYHSDALAIPLASHSVDRIVTDPPWGMYTSAKESLTVFYHTMLGEFYRVLRSKGIAVVVCGATEQFIQAVAEQHTFEIVKRYHVLVAGKKATVYKLRKP